MVVPATSILELFRCPVTHSSMNLLDDGQLEIINERIRSAKAKDRKGREIKVELETGLVKADGSLVYSIRGGIMQLIADEAIVLDQP